jgi:hypothetical protein
VTVSKIQGAFVLERGKKSLGPKNPAGYKTLKLSALVMLWASMFGFSGTFRGMSLPIALDTIIVMKVSCFDPTVVSVRVTLPLDKVGVRVFSATVLDDLLHLIGVRLKSTQRLSELRPVEWWWRYWEGD